ncbi:MAG: glycosyltransferase family 2 protein [Clostridia bacterium]|nr:glycosyltransferase family 2 protein [Clostridia bacterium]
MDKPITFSVIMPCYNSAAYVKNAIDSIKNQTYPHWELIAVNDGSKDETPEILHAYAKEDDRIKVFEKENGGYVSAVNLGLGHISGDYFLFLGSDDTLNVDLFEILFRHLSPLNALPDGIAFRAIKIKDGVFFERDTFSDFDTVAYESNITFKAFCEKHPKHAEIFSCRDTSKCFKTQKLNDLRYFGKYGIDADGIFSSLFYHTCQSFISIPYDGYLWTIRNDSLSSSTSLVKELDRIDNWKLFFERLDEMSLGANITIEALSHISLQCFLLISLCKGFKNAIKYRRFIRQHLTFIKYVAKKYNAEEFLDRKIGFLRFSPPLFSLLHKLGVWSLLHKLHK